MKTYTDNEVLYAKDINASFKECLDAVNWLKDRVARGNGSGKGTGRNITGRINFGKTMPAVPVVSIQTVNSYAANITLTTVDTTGFNWNAWGVAGNPQVVEFRWLAVAW